MKGEIPPSPLSLAQRGQTQEILPSLTIIQQFKIRALVSKGMREGEGIEQVTGRTRHKLAKDAVNLLPLLTVDQFHSSHCKSKNKTEIF